MIRIIGIREGKSGNVVFDDYIPFSFKAYDGVLAGPLMWRTGNLTNSLLEIKIDPDNNELAGVTLVSYQGLVLDKPLLPSWVDMPTENGVPIVDTSVFPVADFPRNRVDEPIELVVALYGSFLEVGFGKLIAPCRQIQSGRLHFWITDDDSLRGFAISKIADDERAKLKTILEGGS